MSLSSLLLGKGKAVDSELDALFKTAPVPKPVATPVAESSKRAAKKRKLEAEKEAIEPVETPSKRSKSISEKGHKQATEKSPKKSKAAIEEPKPKSQKSGKGKKKDVPFEDEDEDDNSDLENKYLKASAPQPAAPAYGTDAELDEEGDPKELVHESLREKKKSSRSKQKFVPSEETAELRDKRTIFIGNLPIDIAQKRPLQKQLHKHILALLPTAKIESTRFRSIPFQAPTSKLPTSDDEGNDRTPAKKPQTPKDVRPHDRERTSLWRSKNDEEMEDAKKDDKKFLNPNQKKKIAFINQEFHSTADTINAYVVFAHPAPVENRSINLPPLPATMDPYEAARLAAEKCDGTLFMERMIRVDLVGKKGVASDKSSRLVDADAKLSVFVGNLDFASKEEDLRVFFEGLVSAERGGPVGEAEEEEEEEVEVKKPKTWVTRVRIVRDKETQLGKGFAYIQFADRECVDEILALEEEKLKFAKRKLRVQRCKSLPGGASVASRKVATEAKGPKPRGAPVPIIPRGNPLLGEKLAHLPKDERKQIKSTDADRVARRLAKKKARNAMGTGAGAVKPKGKERERVRKGPASGKGKSGHSGKNEGSKGRVRSEKSLRKRNEKK
ncbi:hypothetical protein BDQ12DRAFT_691735 [Crucibulum laeve]|uniref:Nucleolar protein 12 n=1 Tax=Crucibulum laeve TaxID=68775 RepID=A0A5C3LM64_9AGAR|nr:hypothetical protein BDQ12DRAFT_691735 [Crucibulum laeve]